VSNASFALLAKASRFTGINTPQFPLSPELREIGGPRRPVAGVVWREARAFCRFLGKELPTSQQWVKAFRGGELLGDKPNPLPRRNLPWGKPTAPVPARVGIAGSADVGSTPGDISPYGVMDLAGNVMEWSDSLPWKTLAAERVRTVRGASWETPATDVVDFVPLENSRAEDQRHFSLGFRCVVN